MNIPIAITFDDADQWVQSLSADDETKSSDMTQAIAISAFLAGAEAQLRRIFPHLFDKGVTP